MTAGKAALAALGLRQERVDFFHQWIAFDAETQRGVAQQQAERGGERADAQYGEQHVSGRRPLWFSRHPRETHERDAHEAGGDERDRRTLER